jgi:tetratricopeptide (TPR) repeat protein
MYLAHNYQFLAFSAAMEGRREEALAAATRFRDVFDVKMMSTPGFDWFATLPYFVMARFAQWNEILTQPAPDPAFTGWTGGYLSAKAMALAATGRVSEARQTWDELEKLRLSVAPDLTAGNNSMVDVLALASAIAQAKIATAEHFPDAAIDALQKAVNLEDGLAYDEPSEWFFPVRHWLGAELLAAHRNAEAESVYREDLKRNPDNGWSLFGLAQSLRAQNKIPEAERAEASFRTAWLHADVQLTSSQQVE